MNIPEQFVSDVDRTIRRRKMLKGGERVLVAVSGGPDSLALLHALFALELDLHIAHFDHRLREGSDRDAAFVARLARRLGIPVTTGSAGPGDPPKGLSPEEAARERRLRFLDDVAGIVGADRIATGHTMDDQAETVLMRLASGAGARGLGGIPPVRGLFVRPLIDRSRDEVEAYCRALRLRPRRDPTNESAQFLRNVIRHEVLPVLARRVNRKTVNALARTADILREEDALLDRLAEESLDVDRAASGTRVSVESLLALPIPLRRRAVRIVIAPHEMDAAHVERVLDLAENGKNGNAVDLPGRLNARLEYGSLLVGRATSPAMVPEPVGVLVPGRTEVPWTGGVLTVWEGVKLPETVPDGRTACVIDGDVASGLAVRTRRRGDRIAPLGMRGTKSVADVIAEDKVPRTQRGLVPIVTSGSDVVWVVGHKMSDRFKVTPRTTRFVWMAFEEDPAWS